jgi:Sporulation and spore germination
MTARRPVRLAAVAAVLTVCACTGVPNSSQPQIVGPVGGAHTSAAPTETPAPGADARTIVKGFLAANVTDDTTHTAAKTFLTAQERTRWLDTTVTIVDTETVGNMVETDADHGTVTVTGRQVGSIDISGIYEPVLNGVGTGGDTVPFQFVLKKVGGQWRIDSLQNGVIVSYADFQRIYQQRPLYFFDLAEQRLVPDPRFTTITDPSQLANWLVRGLAAGPRGALANAVNNQEFPAHTDVGGVSVTLGATTSIEVPGASQQDAATRNHLAAQIAGTLEQATGAEQLTITDGGRPVTIPVAGGASFSPSTFPALDNPSSRTPTVYYLRDGRVVDEFGEAVSGPLGTPTYGLTSVAMSALGTSDLLVAGTSRIKGTDHLWVGTQRSGLHETTVSGSLSRPAWVPDLNEVWVGAGPNIYRVGARGTASQVTFFGPNNSKLSGQVRAIRFSPEGSRVAAVIATPQDDAGQVYIGSVQRNGDAVLVNFQPISPNGVVVTDVAWNDELKLFLIGRYVAATDTPHVFEVQVDGSLWTPRSATNLPGLPDSITVAENAPAWVSVGPSVWVQRGSSWVSPVGEFTAGSNPVYVE